jgi:putative ABC transport system permease protein
MRRNPGFTAVAVVTLALGIGANTAIFSLVSPYLFKALPFGDADRLVHLFHIDYDLGFNQARFSLPQYADYEAGFESFEDLGLYTYGVKNVTGHGEPESVTVGRVTANTMSLLAVEPALGRAFLPDEDRPGAPPVAILSHGLWQRRYAGDRGIIGQTIKLDEVPHNVIGIMPRDFVFPYGGVKMWTALQEEPATADRAQGSYLIIGRLKSGATLERAQVEMQTIHGRLSAEYPDLDGRFGVRAVPIRAGLMFFYDVIRGMLLLLMAAVGFVLMIVAANVGNIMLARATAREREVAIRAALGSNRLRLIRQFLTESAVLAGVGSIMGVAIATGVVRQIGPTMPEDLYRVGNASVDGAALGFTVLVAVVAVLFFGLAPALQASRLDMAATIKEGGRGSSAGAKGKRLRSALVVAQVAMTLVLLIGAAITIQTLIGMQRIDPGFDTDRALTMRVRLSVSKYREVSQRAAFQEEVMRRVEALPQVEAAGGVASLPLDFSTSYMGFEVEGRPPATPDERLFANENRVTPGYFAAMGIPLLRGRPFEQGDSEDAPRVIAINQTMAERYWPGNDPVGRRVLLDPDEDAAEWATIVAVVGDVRHRLLTREVDPQIYIPQGQSATRAISIIVRTAGEPSSVAAAVREAIWSVDPGLPVGGARTLRQVLAQSLGPFQIVSGLLSLFGLLALLLACVGLYGVVAYSVSRRVSEFGIRMALGADRADILTLVIRHGAILAGVGVAIGLLISVGLTKVMAGAVAGAEMPGIPTFAGVALLLTLVALAASYVPARRAAKEEPVTALRYE